MTAPAFAAWRSAARDLLVAGVAPDAVDWQDGRPAVRSPAVFAVPAVPAVPAGVPSAASPRISRRLLRLLELLACFRHPGRWHLMYRLVWRIVQHNPRLLEDAADPDVVHALRMAKAVGRDVHKMHAFVRFNEIADEAGSRWFAWFEPQHEILRRGVPFFCKRFPNMAWTIATPDGSAVWREGRIEYLDAPAARAVEEDRGSTAAGDDPCTLLWRRYYRSICNVARINPKVMQREMPQRYWRHLPEAVEIVHLVREGRADFARIAHERQDHDLALAKGVQTALAALPLPAAGPGACRRCDLWRNATQAVAGAGPREAAIVLVGEQPGDEEDLCGQPFVGPAGKVLDAALADAGLDRRTLYITNAVKHFKWKPAPRGKRRLHQKPQDREIAACRDWLTAEIAGMQPRVIVALGATALRSLYGRDAPTVEQGRSLTLRHPGGAQVIATYHPSAVLRAEPAHAQTLRAHLTADLARARLAGERRSQ